MSQTYTLELLFSDVSMGHPDLGFLARFPDEDEDTEDIRFERYVRLARPDLKDVRVWDGKVSFKK